MRFAGPPGGGGGGSEARRLEGCRKLGGQGGRRGSGQQQFKQREEPPTRRRSRESVGDCLFHARPPAHLPPFASCPSAPPPCLLHPISRHGCPLRVTGALSLPRTEQLLLLTLLHTPSVTGGRIPHCAIRRTNAAPGSVAVKRLAHKGCPADPRTPTAPEAAAGWRETERERPSEQHACHVLVLCWLESRTALRCAGGRPGSRVKRHGRSPRSSLKPRQLPHPSRATCIFEGATPVACMCDELDLTLHDLPASQSSIPWHRPFALVFHTKLPCLSVSHCMSPFRADDLVQARPGPALRHKA